MDTITAEELQAACLEILKQVQATGRPVRITLRGKPIVELTPLPEGKAPARRPADGMDSMAHCTKIKGDITVPSSELVRWEVLDK